MRRAENETVRLRGPAQRDQKEASDHPESGTTPTAQEVCFEAGVTLCIALGVALIVQLLLSLQPFGP